MKGTVKFYNRKQDFGFIQSDEGKEYYFNAYGVRPVREKDPVSFVVEDTPRGEVAKNIQVLHGDTAKKPLVFLLPALALLIGLVIGHFI